MGAAPRFSVFLMGGAIEWSKSHSQQLWLVHCLTGRRLLWGLGHQPPVHLCVNWDPVYVCDGRTSCAHTRNQTVVTSGLRITVAPPFGSGGLGGVRFAVHHPKRNRSMLSSPWRLRRRGVGDDGRLLFAPAQFCALPSRAPPAFCAPRPPLAGAVCFLNVPVLFSFLPEPTLAIFI